MSAPGGGLLHDLAAASAEVTGLSGRLEKIGRLADALAAVPPEWAGTAVAWLSGELLRGRIGVGGATLREAFPDGAASEPALTLEEVDATFAAVAAEEGAGSVARKVEALRSLLARATPVEQEFLAGLLMGELRQGAQEGILLEAVARATGVPASTVRRAVMLRGDAAAVGGAVLREGAGALEDVALRVLRPLKPMLAKSAGGVEAALQALGTAAFEHKLDGARVQVHKAGDEVRIFTRRLNDETAALPDLVEVARALPADEVILDGEALALDGDGRPRPFQETMRRFGRVRDVEELAASLPLTPVFFDCLHLDGETLLDLPARERWEALDAVVPAAARSTRLLTDDPAAAADFLRAARAAGHEGLMAKDPASAYVAGRRGGAWLKVKPAWTADLVVLAAEWGSGRRTGWLSNLHLGARGGSEGEWVMVGKTFKGMTDAMLEWQTARLGGLAVSRGKRVVRVRPELVVEVAFDGVQTSPRYPGGVALRFARVKGYREDKAPADADSIDFLRDIHAGRL